MRVHAYFFRFFFLRGLSRNRTGDDGNGGNGGNNDTGAHTNQTDARTRRSRFIMQIMVTPFGIWFLSLFKYSNGTEKKKQRWVYLMDG